MIIQIEDDFGACIHTVHSEFVAVAGLLGHRLHSRNDVREQGVLQMQACCQMPCRDAPRIQR